MVIEFMEYALIWWDQIVIRERRDWERPVRTFGDIKVLMSKRFMPNHL